MLSLDFFFCSICNCNTSPLCGLPLATFFLYKAKSFITIEAIHIPKTAVT